MRNSESSVQELRFLGAPEIVIGSHDSLLEWGFRESGEYNLPIVKSTLLEPA
jgi:hypothetical protein